MSDIVLLHGVGLDHTMWERVADRLTEQHRVSAPDLLGHGTAPDAAPGTTLADLADLARSSAGFAGSSAGFAGSSAGFAGSPVHLVGFSLGALVATRVALDVPSQVASLTLVSGVANRSAAERDAVAGRLRSARENLDATFTAAIERWFSPRWSAREPELTQRVLATLRANRPASYLACYSVFAEADAQLWPLLGRLSMPVLAITGADDPGSTPAMASALASRVPDGRAVSVPNARHLLPLECPESVVDAVLCQVNDFHPGAPTR